VAAPMSARWYIHVDQHLTCTGAHWEPLLTRLSPTRCCSLLLMPRPAISLLAPDFPGSPDSGSWLSDIVSTTTTSIL
jgi:hypothetical protein